MNVREVGDKLVALCRANQANQAMETLYDPNIFSVEAAANPGGSREVRGIAACFEKGKQFDSQFQIHGVRAEGPFPHDDRFAVFFQYDVTHKPSGQRSSLDEVAVYTVKNGKIVREEFYYAPPPGM